MTDPPSDLGATASPVQDRPKQIFAKAKVSSRPELVARLTQRGPRGDDECLGDLAGGAALQL